MISKQTNWDEYYSNPYKTATYSRKITTDLLTNYIREYVGVDKCPIIAELGGANSCFYDAIEYRIKPSQYHVIDKNRLGLELLRAKEQLDNRVVAHEDDVLDLSLDLEADLVFSVGLVEHFLEEDTKKAIGSHFKLLKPNGICIISFPTPTFLYKCSRTVAELLGLWIFHDERPMELVEFENAVSEWGVILSSRIIWPIFFTQAMYVLQKR